MRRTVGLRCAQPNLPVLPVRGVDSGEFRRGRVGLRGAQPNLRSARAAAADRWASRRGYGWAMVCGRCGVTLREQRLALFARMGHLPQHRAALIAAGDSSAASGVITGPALGAHRRSRYSQPSISCCCGRVSATPAAEGATRSESLRQTDRGSRLSAGLTLESGGAQARPTEGEGGSVSSILSGYRTEERRFIL
jgi:hypothetical protein